MSEAKVMTFDEAAGEVIPFGPHKGKKVVEIGSTDEGLIYLDWVRGQDWTHGNINTAVKFFLDDPAIVDDLNKALSERKKAKE